MRSSLDDLEQVDRLTDKEWPFLSASEWLEFRKKRDFLRDGRAETQSTIWIRDEEADQPQEDEDEDTPPRQGGYRLDQGKLTLNQFHYMCTGWNLYEPAADGQQGAPIPFTAENREKFVRKFGVYVMGQLLMRGGGIEPAAKLEGKTDADGEPLTFPDDAGLRPGRRVHAPGAAGKLRAAEAVHDRKVAGVHVG